jgi:hypothetical protein
MSRYVRAQRRKTFADASFAGQQESFLNVRGDAALLRTRWVAIPAGARADALRRPNARARSDEAVIRIDAWHLRAAT